MKPIPLILKIVLLESHIDTNTTSNEISKKLSNIDTYIAPVRNDITKLNGHVRTPIQLLPTRVNTIIDLL